MARPRRPDESRWTGQKLDEAAGGIVPRSYFTNLLKGRVESPGYEKMLAIAKAMGFPPEAWFVDGVGNEPELDWGLAGALGDETIRETVREMSRLSKREKRLVLGIMRQFENSGELLSGSLSGRVSPETPSPRACDSAPCWRWR